MSIPHVMHQAMKAFAPLEANRDAAIVAAITAGKDFLAACHEEVTPEKAHTLQEAAEETWVLYCGVSTSRLLSQELLPQLPPLYSQEHTPDPLVICRFYTPDAGWTWYAYEFDGLDTFFGFVVGLEKELGYFLLSELEVNRGPLGLPIERDEHFIPLPLSRVRALHEQAEAQPLQTFVVLLSDELAAQMWDKEYEVTSICRDDLTELGATLEQLLLLTDEDMAEIARAVGDAHVEFGGFWEDLRTAVNRVLTEKGVGELAEPDDEEKEEGPDTSGPAVLAQLEGVEVQEVHADGQIERREDIDVFSMASHLVLRSGVTYYPVCSCAEGDADFGLCRGVSTAYACYLWRDENIVEFATRSEVLAFLQDLPADSCLSGLE